MTDSSSTKAVSFFIPTHSVTLSVVAMCVSNPERSTFTVKRIPGMLAILQPFRAHFPLWSQHERGVDRIFDMLPFDWL
jgi:hypothetical protein